MIRFIMLLACLYIILGVGLLVYPSTYIAELLISFLPYILWGGVVLLLLLLGYSIIEVSKKKKQFLILALVVCGIFVIQYFYTYVSFYKNFEVREGEDGLSILYGNIWYQNENMSELLDKINMYESDMLFFVEYTPEHHSVLYKSLSEMYPYINTDYPESKGPAGKVVYSKFPFENLAPTLQGSDQWRYGYISMMFNDQEYVFYLVHTSAPISPSFFLMRNNQLFSLGNAVVYDMQDVHQGSVMTVLGDFNISPWSSAYDGLEKSLSSFTNVSAYVPGLTTWGYAGSVIRSHIDHIWINTPQRVKELFLIPIEGSDHDLIYMQLYKK